MRYSPERKEAVLRKMMPPHNRSIKKLSQEEGISEATLFNWRLDLQRGLYDPFQHLQTFGVWYGGETMNFPAASYGVLNPKRE